MEETNNLLTVPLMMYNRSLHVNLEMYDKMPYVRDESLCNKSTVRLISGNIIKFYRCRLLEPYYLDSDHIQ
ncbi:hypothetical protein [Anaeromicropila herbilytica]|uniref:Uncharacterized protein n=1 Tax=Anaeromicropila herbilytica TaxID=2785025 RepID=A0A7R7EN42_9FIRM|nr:hypothetical protein [Anaeromicropila herbilytica]BCN32005.1 hypothetical protein bsdtb5_33000 [Anaeromicropila herbilytica]